MRDRSPWLKRIHTVVRQPYYQALCLLYRRGIPVKLQQRSFRLHPRLLGMRPSEYEADLSAVMASRIGLGMTVLDIGAHVGLHSLCLSRQVGSAGRIVAVEPSPPNASLLRQHLAWNRCSNVTVIEAAVGESAGEIAFTFRPDATDPGAFANSMAYDIGGDDAQVKVTTIDAICAEFTPNVIKIDVEGAELLVIRGAREVLSRGAPVLFIAVHPGAMSALGTSPGQLIELMAELGYKGRHLDGTPATELAFEEIVFEKEPAVSPPAPAPQS